DKASFSIGVSGYPEKHFESPNLLNDVRWVKKKVDAGADYIVTQMFFDNAHYFRFVEMCRAEGVDVPIIPGLKVLDRKRHLRSIPSAFHCEIPAPLADEVEKAKKGEVREIGVEWALNQAQELIDKGVPSVHFYVMQSSVTINKLLARLKV
ncbi:MAG: methylenetetrahydrofolate reductase, partial [Acidobacteriota bacterium]